MPPDYLRGRCDPHPANDEKRYVLYWGTLKDLGSWTDEEYLRRKERVAAQEDRREVMPDCVIQVW